MFVRRNIPWSWTLYYSWPSLLYFLTIAVLVYVFRGFIDRMGLSLPKEPVTITATALAIFLGFKNSEAYERWWEARKIWGLAVNYSRAWSRQVLTLISAPPEDSNDLKSFQTQLIYRHAAFVHALRIYLRSTISYPLEDTSNEAVSARNDYAEFETLISEEEYHAVIAKENPPEALIQIQGRALRAARDRGWLSDYLLVQLDQTLVEFNNIQGMAERIKKTPLPRPYSYFQRLIVHVLGTMLPFAFVSEMNWMLIPVSFVVSFVFLALDLIGSRVEDPFENRVDDAPMSSLCRTIERNLRESLDEPAIPPPLEPHQGVLL